jgi:hypothetical protein
MALGGRADARSWRFFGSPSHLIAVGDARSTTQMRRWMPAHTPHAVHIFIDSLIAANG